MRCLSLALLLHRQQQPCGVHNAVSSTGTLNGMMLLAVTALLHMKTVEARLSAQPQTKGVVSAVFRGHETFFRSKETTAHP